MTDLAAHGAQQHLEMIEGLTQCAYELGKAAHRIALQSEQRDAKAFLAASAEFRHCFFSVRMGVRLAAQLRAGQSFAALRTARADEMERPDAVERPEREDREPGERLEREREGDYEAVSLPKFLQTLGLVARAAERRGDELPAHIRDTTLPRLKGLLAEANAPAAPAAKTATGLAVLTLPAAPPSPAGKSRLLTSVVTPPPRPRDSG